MKSLEEIKAALREHQPTLREQYHVERIGIFCSHARREHTAISDVDILVEFEPAAAASFQNFLDLKESLEALLGRSVDLVELHAVRNRRLRHYIEKSRSPIYDAA